MSENNDMGERTRAATILPPSMAGIEEVVIATHRRFAIATLVRVEFEEGRPACVEMVLARTEADRPACADTVPPTMRCPAVAA